MKQNKGFTLIELLIALTIIAILSGAALAALTGFRASARDTRRIADLQNMQSYLELYFNRCGRYPGDATCGGTNPTNWAQVTTSLGAIMDVARVPKDPVAARTYSYGVDTTAGSEGLRYVVGATLETSNSVLQNDIDGNVYGVDCGTAASDTIYCIQS
jgi:prepilin-type N-terminal cleavage/methylation domain-containing protein